MSRRIPKEIKEEIISKVQGGERVADLAEQYAVSTKTMYAWLRQDTGEGSGLGAAIQQAEARKRRTQAADW